MLFQIDAYLTLLIIFQDVFFVISSSQYLYILNHYEALEF